MISEGLVHLVASDAHRPEGRSPSLVDAITVINQLFGEETRNLLFSDNPAHLIAGTALIGPIKIDRSNQHHKTTGQKRGWLDRLKISIR
jgi:tyrosine-protein phosphatase YwqE